ncbi:MAG: rhomboid family intramembrane serine protease [Proteobacteria bacterium]|nr:MAG: rhomboid family intramembrane serine protease [Pseudomonadota bacterium]
MIPLHDDNPTTIRPYVTVAVIVMCGVAFLWQLSSGPQGQQIIAFGLGAVPAVLFGHAELPPELYFVPASLTVFSSMFLHGGWMHLIGNMLYLWIFGNNVEDSMGHVRFVVFYLVCGIAAVFAHALPNAESQIPMIGASGAISGVLGAYVLLYPHARVLVLIPLGIFFHTVRLKAMWVLGFWIVLQLVSSAFADPSKGGVAFGAHIGGFVAGLALIPFFKYRKVPLLSRRSGSGLKYRE